MVYAFPEMKNLRKLTILSAVALTAVLAAAGLYAQMVSPSIDRPGEPFSYFSKPTTEIGMMDAEAATEITPEGYLRTGFGELMFFAGPELEPTSVRIRTLEDGRLPIVNYQFVRDGVVYRFTLFAATLDGRPPTTPASPTATTASTGRARVNSQATTGKSAKSSAAIGCTPTFPPAFCAMAACSTPSLAATPLAVTPFMAATTIRRM